MSNIEEEFYKTFGIEKQVPCKKCNMHNTKWNCNKTCLHDDDKEKIYPPITSEILLKLICILMNGNTNVSIQNYDKPIDVNGFKNLILTACIDCAECIKDKVKSLLEGEGEE